MIRFDGQVAVVTGSGRGLGAAYARLLAAYGAYVLVHDAGVAIDGSGADTEPADRVVAEIRAAGGVASACYENLETPSGCRSVIDAALATYDRLDILIHNAGLLAFAPIEETDLALWVRMLKVNVEAPFLLTQAAFPQMKRQQYGRIVFTTSGRAMYIDAAQPGLSAYAAGKMAQLGLMNVLAAEGAPFNIRVNAVSPVAATRMLQRAAAPNELEPAHVAPGVAFLASEACDVSGVVLRASNGHFSIAHWAFSAGVAFGTEPSTPTAIAESWADIISDAR